MIKRLIIIGGIVVLVILALVGYSVFRTPEAPSGQIEAIPITQATVVVEPTSASTSSQTNQTTSVATTSSTAQIFELVSAESEARFLIDEVLRGADVTVVGATDQVAGQMVIDPSDPTGAQVGIIQVNARTLATDNEFRNRAIKNAILSTDSYEFVTFTPTDIGGLPETVTVGTPFTFQLTGDLTIKETTRAVTFAVTVTPVSATELNGTATTSVLYRDFDLTIPDSPSVDTVADEVRLEIDFVARASAE